MKKNNGVTMIVLVITIVILVIIAGISIAHILGDHGVITKATKMEDETAKAEVRDHFLKLLNSELVSASNDIVGTTDDISTRFNEPKLINFLKGNPNYTGENTESDVKTCIEEFQEGTEDVKPKAGDGTIKTKYRVISDDLFKESDKYGRGKSIKDGDIFTLEAVCESIGEDGTPIGYDGKFQLKYYDKDGKETIIDTLSLYLTNQS